MSETARRLLSMVLGSVLLQPATVLAAHDVRPKVEVRAFVNDSCIVADEPYFLPATGTENPADNAKFLPLLGLVIGKLTELFINHEIQASADRMKAGAVRKDTRYAVSRHMNLYRADFQPAPTLHINARLGCMTIVAGSFRSEPATCTAEYLPKTLSRPTTSLPEDEWQTSRTDASIENRLRRANVCVEGKARAVYEARFEFSKDGTAYRLEDAGYQIETLLTTQDKGAVRNTLYTLRISNPGAGDQQEVLSSAWVSLGAVTAGAHSSGARTDTAPWLAVPPLSVEARRHYDEKTQLQQEDYGEIEALKRALVRNQRLLAGLDQRIATAAPELLEGLRQERTRIAVQNQTQGAELDARNAEYQELPRGPLEFMPVTIEVAVTETESEKTARLALADIIGKNGGVLASAAGGAANGLLSKSVDLTDVKTDPGEKAGADVPGPHAAATETSGTELAQLRDRYFDALIDVQTADGRVDLQNSLVVARDRYNAARRSFGLEPLK